MPGRYDKGSPPTKEDFTGHVKDEATGLHYAGARYYSSAFARWTTTEPLLQSKSPKKLLQNNPRILTQTSYGYAFSNPVTLSDPDGRCPVFGLDGLCSGVASGFGSGVKNTVMGLVNTVANPVETGQNLYSAAVNYEQTYEVVKDQIGAQIEKFSSGDLNAKGEVVGGAIALIAEAAVGSKGAGKLGKLSKVAKAAEKAGDANSPLVKALSNAKRVGDRLETKLDDGGKVVFRRDVGEDAHPLPGAGKSGDVDHYNIELHAPKKGRPNRYKQKMNAHIIFDSDGNVTDIYIPGK